LETLLPEGFQGELEKHPKEILIIKIRERVLFLLQNDFEFLVQALYRLDISEAKFQTAMLGDTLEEISEALASLIYEREIQKYHSRKKYNTGKE